MDTLKVKFTDFLGDYRGSVIYQVLSEKYFLEESDHPDFLFYSNYGYQFKEYSDINCVKVFYTNENIVPDFNECDYAIGFDDLIFGDRYLRLPFSYLQLKEEWKQPRQFDRTQALQRKFCNFIYSNNFSGVGAKLREEFAKQLMEYKQVDCPGKVLNNMKDAITPRFGDWQAGKLEFMKNYKFSIAFENSRTDGYVTEKLVHPFAAGSIPIYWGNPKVAEDFNSKAFINCNEYENLDEVIAKIKELDNNDDLYMEMLSQPPLVNKHLPNIEDLRVFLYNIVQKGNMPFVKNPHGISEAKFLRQENQMLKDEIYALKQRKSFPFIKTVVKHGYLKYYFLGINIYKKKLSETKTL